MELNDDLIETVRQIIYKIEHDVLLNFIVAQLSLACDRNFMVKKLVLSVLR